ncbi:hypothetical protein ACWED2_22000 [Amycolatopsis sp. NPDC005003]
MEVEEQVKIRFALEARCIDLPSVPLRWWITVIVVIILVPAHQWAYLVDLLEH